MNKEDKWADKLRHKMNDYAEPLPEGMWNKIEHDLPAPRVIPMWRRVWSYAAAVLVLLVSSWAVWYWSSSPSSYLVQETEKNEVLLDQVTEQIESVRESLVNDSQNEQLADAVGTKAAAPVRMSEPKEEYMAFAPVATALMAEAGVVSVDDTDESEECEAETLTDSETAIVKEKEVQASLSRSRIVSDREIMEQNARNYKHRKKHSEIVGWEVGVSAGNIPYTASHTNSGMRNLSPYVAYKYMEDVNSLIRSSADIYRAETFATEVKHKLPIVVNATFRYNFTHHWGIETGLSYTLLSSDWISSDEVNVYQKLHYIGIPLKVNYNILHSRFFTLYASAGGMMEKCVHAELGKRNGYGPDTSPESLDDKPFQWSVSAAVGAQFNIVHHFGLFVEPGVSYYFDDHSVYQTIRKEHPFNFNFNLGLRVSFGR